MLLLGAVALFEPVNGYQIRRELLSWQVDRWAHTNPGSIYHGLAALAKQGHLERHDLTDGGREVAVYEMTDPGRDELHRLMVTAIETVDPFDRAPFTAAFSMLPLLPDKVAWGSLVRRRVALEAAVGELATPPDDGAPPQATRGQVLWLDLAVAELGWLRETIELIRSGDLPATIGSWAPPADDPGWQMEADRERYRALLGR